MKKLNTLIVFFLIVFMSATACAEKEKSNMIPKPVFITRYKKRLFKKGESLEDMIKRGHHLSKNFTSSEFVCKCCGEVIIDQRLIDKLELLRAELGRPIIITSGYRCPKHNREVGGVVNSQHILGKAVDIKVRGVSPKKVGEVARKIGFSFIKVYSSWTHIDIRREK